MKFASPARKNTWYLKYKNCKQAGRTIDTYALKFQANWRKVDQRGMMPPDSVLADFMSELDPQKHIIHQTIKMPPKTTPTQNPPKKNLKTKTLTQSQVVKPQWKPFGK